MKTSPGPVGQSKDTKRAIEKARKAAARACQIYSCKVTRKRCGPRARGHK